MRLKINIYICCRNLYLKLMNALCWGESLQELLISILPNRAESTTVSQKKLQIPECTLSFRENPGGLDQPMPSWRAYLSANPRANGRPGAGGTRRPKIWNRQVGADAGPGSRDLVLARIGSGLLWVGGGTHACWRRWGRWELTGAPRSAYRDKGKRVSGRDLFLERRLWNAGLLFAHQVGGREAEGFRVSVNEKSVALLGRF